MKDVQVAIKRGERPAEAVKAALDLLGGMRGVIRAGDSVLIKPNLSVPMDSVTGATTNTEVVVGLIKAAKEAGAGDVFVAESAIVGMDAGHIMKRLGVKSIFEQAGARVINLDEDQHEVAEIRVPGGVLLEKVSVYRAALDCDLLISVPVLKTHIYTTVSLGMKNLKGTLPDFQKKAFHRVEQQNRTDETLELERCIAELMSVHRPALTLIDATVGQEGFVAGVGVCGRPVPMKAVVAGMDPVAVDAVGAHLMGIDPMEVKHIRLCNKMGIGRAELEEITFLGDPPGRIRRIFKRAIPGEIVRYPNVEVIEGGSCSGCSFAIRWTLGAFSEEQVHRWERTVFLVGSDIRVPERLTGQPFLVGKCACGLDIPNAVKITGCPPPFWHMRGVLARTDRGL